MKIVVFEAEEWERVACLALEPTHAVVCRKEPLKVGGAGEFADAEAISTFVNSDLGATVLKHLSNLKLIATRSTGYDHIDLDY